MKEYHYNKKELPDKCCAKCRRYSKVTPQEGYCMRHRRTAHAKDELSCFTK